MSGSRKAGEKVKKSGIYVVRHDKEHVEDHDVTCVAGKTFPECLECGDGVRFLLVRHAIGVGSHEAFRFRATER
jgi:hypothetical protein